MFSVAPLHKFFPHNSGLKQEEARAAMNSFGVFTAEQAREESLRKADPYFDFSKTNIAFQDLLDQEYEKLQKRKEGVPYVESQWRYEPEKEPEKATNTPFWMP